LAGVAGIIVAVGFTADSFIVYFERIRDALRDGFSIESAVEHGWKRAFRTVLASDGVNFLAAVILFSLKNNTSILSLGDITTAVAPIGLLLGRLANFVNGELWGRAADPALPWAMIFPTGGPLPRHPSQLYEAGLEGVVLFTLLAVMIRIGALKRPGLILGSFIAFYGFARIVSEFFREPDPQLGFLWGGLTMGMLLSVPMIVAGAIIIAAAWRREARTPAAVSDQGAP